VARIFLVDFPLDAFDHLVRHDAAARAQNRQSILDDEGISVALPVVRVPAQDSPPSQVG